MNQDPWMSSFSAYGPAYNTALDSRSDMFYNNVQSPRLGDEPPSLSMPPQQSPLLPPFPQYPSIQPSLNSNNNSINMNSFKPFQNNFMYFEPRPQPQPMPMNYAMPQSMMMSPMFAGGGQDNCSWYNNSLQRLIRDDEMYFGRSGIDGNITRECGGNGGSCQAGWLPDDSRNNSWLPDDSQNNSWLPDDSQKKSWTGFDPNMTVRPPGMPAAAPQASASMWQGGSGSYGERQLLPDI